jgi:hypothetical protein
MMKTEVDILYEKLSSCYDDIAKLEAKLEWFGNFADIVQTNHNLYDLACEYADDMERYTKEYPFDEGDDYWTIEDNEIVWSCWDDVSEEIHAENPNQMYFDTEYKAHEYLRENCGNPKQ